MSCMGCNVLAIVQKFVESSSRRKPMPAAPSHTLKVFGNSFTVMQPNTGMDFDRASVFVTSVRSKLRARTTLKWLGATGGTVAEQLRNSCGTVAVQLRNNAGTVADQCRNSCGTVAEERRNRNCRATVLQLLRNCSATVPPRFRNRKRIEI